MRAVKRPAQKPLKKITAAHFRTGAVFEFTLDGTRFVGRRSVRAKTDAVFGPDLLDLQCNGYAGIDFNHPDTTAQRMAAGIRAMWRDGCAHVTVAPEVGGPTPFIRQLRVENVLPALAHTMADAATISRACDAGALMSMGGVPLAEARLAASERAWNLLRLAGAVKRVPDSTVFAHWHGGKFDVRATLHGKRVLWAK